MPSPGHPDAESDAGPVPIQDAAVRLGTSPEAIRKRLARGSLRGEKHAGRWVVWLPQDEADSPASGHQDAEPDTRQDVEQDSRPDATIAELRARLADTQGEVVYLRG